MSYFLYGLFFLSCIVMIITVLLQPGKTDAGALFTSSVSSNAYGSRGTATVLSKTTIISATIFMLSALMLSMPALTGNVSVLSTNPDTTTEAPAASTNSNSDVNSNSSPNVAAPVANTAEVAPPAAAANSNASKPADKKEEPKKEDPKKDAPKK